MPELPNLPGVRRDLSLLNPKLYREYKASLSQESLSDVQQPPPLGMVEEENSLMSYFENTSKIAEYSQLLSPFPASGGSYNDIGGRYSLVSQQQDRLRKSRSLPYTNTNNLPSFISNEGRVCRFIAYFTEVPREGVENRSRMVVIKLYLEDNSIEMQEPRVENSGTTQGKFLKRHQIYKPNSQDVYSIQDFTAGAEVEIYNRIYTICDCDNGTKKYLESRGLPFGPKTALPATMYDPKDRPGMSRAPPRTAARETKNKDYFQYDTKVLRFYGVWDCRDQLFGDEINVKVHYLLAENKIEVVPIGSRNSGRDRLPKLLKKTTIMKKADAPYSLTSPSRKTGDFNFAAEGQGSIMSQISEEMKASGMLMGPPPGSAPKSAHSRSGSPSRVGTANTATLQSLSEMMQPTSSYHWTDLKVGMVIPVASMTILLCDADDFTREFYKSKSIPLDPPIVREVPTYPAVQTTIPPYNGFGSEEDSLQTCKQSLVLSAPSKDGAKLKQLANMILRFEAVLTNPTVSHSMFRVTGQQVKVLCFCGCFNCFVFFEFLSVFIGIGC
jgi:hypothetical protein